MPLGILAQLFKGLMINSIEDLRSAGVLPTGPVSAWPQERNVEGPGLSDENGPVTSAQQPQKVRATLAEMASGVVKNAARAVKGGKVNPEIREERIDTCRKCPFFMKNSKRCSECGCFMEAKTWINADPKVLCPKQKWDR